MVSNSCIQSGAYRIVRRCLSCSFQTLTHHHLSHHAQCTPLARLELGRPTEARRGRTGTWPAAQGASSQASSVLVSFPSPLSLRTDSQVCPARCSQSCPQLFGMFLPVKAPILPTRHVHCFLLPSFMEFSFSSRLCLSCTQAVQPVH